MKNILLLFAIGCVLAACTPDPDLKMEEAQAIQLKAGLEQKVVADNDFAFNLLKQTSSADSESNIFVSPLSVSIAFGMAWNGANGDTRSGIENALKMNEFSIDDINEYYRTMQTELPKIDPSTQLSIANSMWYRQTFPIKQTFLDVNQANFNAYVKGMDFNADWATDTINNWCSAKTKGLIKTILTEPIPEEAVLYLINAVYFKGVWCKKFDKDKTYEGEFLNNSNTYVPVNYMSLKDTFSYYNDDRGEYVDIPYGNKAFSMTIVLPAAGTAVEEMLNSLNGSVLKEIYSNMNNTEVLVKMPRFKVESEYVLNNILKNMGMTDAFDPDRADFSGISDISLYISNVLHKTYITVDEDGTEAAAVTSIGIETTSMPLYKIFSVSRPFIYLIREKSTGVILFAGVMKNPVKY